jgi:hypothetical protein
MRFWLREIAGWLMVALGLFGFYVCFVLVLYRQILEAWPWTIVSVVLFRGGIHLLKVAVAARICMQATERAEEQRPAAPRTAPAAAKVKARPLPIGARDPIFPR